MKELLAILAAMERARSALTSHSQPREHRFPEEVIQELLDILDTDELTCALEKVQASIGSPPLAPDAPPLESAPVEE
jgi:hypothetical protein